MSARRIYIIYIICTYMWYIYIYVYIHSWLIPYQSLRSRVPKYVSHEFPWYSKSNCSPKYVLSKSIYRGVIYNAYCAIKSFMYRMLYIYIYTYTIRYNLWTQHFIESNAYILKHVASWGRLVAAVAALLLGAAVISEHWELTMKRLEFKSSNGDWTNQPYDAYFWIDGKWMWRTPAGYSKRLLKAWLRTLV